MKDNKKLFPYKNKIILTNGSSFKITSIKYIENYQLNLNIFEKKNEKKINQISEKKKSSFIKNIINDF